VCVCLWRGYCCVSVCLSVSGSVCQVHWLRQLGWPVGTAWSHVERVMLYIHVCLSVCQWVGLSSTLVTATRPACWHSVVSCVVATALFTRASPKTQKLRSTLNSRTGIVACVIVTQAVKSFLHQLCTVQVYRTAAHTHSRLTAPCPGLPG